MKVCRMVQTRVTRINVGPCVADHEIDILAINSPIKYVYVLSLPVLYLRDRVDELLVLPNAFLVLLNRSLVLGDKFYFLYFICFFVGLFAYLGGFLQFFLQLLGVARFLFFLVMNVYSVMLNFYWQNLNICKLTFFVILTQSEVRCTTG